MALERGHTAFGDELHLGSSEAATIGARPIRAPASSLGLGGSSMSEWEGEEAAAAVETAARPPRPKAEVTGARLLLRKRRMAAAGLCSGGGGGADGGRYRVVLESSWWAPQTFSLEA